MERLKQEQRAARAAQRETRRQEFQAWWKDAQARQQEYAAQRAEHLKQIAPQVAQLREDARDAHAAHMANLNKAALWLYTRVGVVTCLALFVLAFVVSLATGFFFVPMALAVALAVADVHNLSTLHGRIPWRAWFLGHPALTGCLAMIMVACYYVIVAWYLIQNLRLAPTVRKVRHERSQETIARLEHDLFPDLPTP
jgi:hypothetical protein